MTAVETAVEKPKVTTIIVNTKPNQWAEKAITFEQVVELAFPGQPYDPQGTTVEYSRGHGADKSLRLVRRQRQGRNDFRCRAANRS